MKWENLTEAQIAWVLCNLHERFTQLLWDRYEKEFLNWAMDENDRKQMEKMFSEEFDDLFEPEF
jgi:hypothetical protein